MFHKIQFFCLLTLSLFGIEHVYFKTPKISKESVVGTNVGIRPHRKGGVRIEGEWIEDKWVIHNYGYGGSGLTLAFGGAKRVLEILDSGENHEKRIAVLGGGVIGLATAYDLLENGYEVHIYADNWSPNLTSNVAAGIWTPFSPSTEITLEKEELHQWLKESSRSRLLKSIGEFPEFLGVRWIPYYGVLVEDASDREEVMIHFDNGITKSAMRKYRIGIDGKLFMEDLYAKVQRKGAILEERHFATLQDLYDLEESIIINCMSFGSLEVFHDLELIPVRGQIVYFARPEDMDYMLWQFIPESNYFFFIYPWSDRMILGGIHEKGEGELVITPEVIDTIIGNGERFFSGDL